jgi:hypothetical protein
MTKYVTREELAGVVQTLRDEIAELRRELHSEVDRLDQAIVALRHDLNAAVSNLEQRLDGIEHRLNRVTGVMGTGFLVVFLVELLILRKVGL